MCYKRFIATSLLVASFLYSVAQGYAWTHLGPFKTPVSNAVEGQWSCTGMGWIESLHVSDDLRTLYAGTITSGLYRSTDGGEHWVHLTKDGMQYGALDLDVADDLLFLATGLTHYGDKFSKGVVVSADGGIHWDTTGLQFKPQDKQVVWGVKRVSKRCLLAVTQDGIYRTVDQGLSWNRVLDIPQAAFRQLLISARRKRCLVAGKQLLISRDGGKQWKDITHRLSIFKAELKATKQIQRIAICEDPNNKRRYLALYQYKNMTYLDESRDGGKRWTNLFQHYKIKRIDINHAEVAIAPGSPEVIVIGGVKAYISRDNGEHFDQMTFPRYGNVQYVHDDIRSMVIKDSSHFFLGTDGGVFASSDGGRSWNNLNGTGLCGIMCYGIGLLDHGFMVGCQDLGSFIYRDSSWLNIGWLYGDGGDVQQMGDQIVSVLSGTIRSMNAESLRSTRHKTPAQRMRPFTAKLGKHPKKDQLYFVADHLWTFVDNQWVNLTEKLPDNGGYKANCYAQNDSIPELLFFAIDQPSWGNVLFNNKLHRSTDGGVSWENITEQLPILKWRYITGIASHAQAPDELCVSLGMNDEAEPHKVYKSVDRGEHWFNWSEGLSGMHAFKIMHIKGSTSGYFLSCTDGLYYRNNTMDSWEGVNGAIPQIAIRDFEIDYVAGKLYAATYGNGVWVLELTDELLKS